MMWFLCFPQSRNRRIDRLKMEFKWNCPFPFCLEGELIFFVVVCFFFFDVSKILLKTKYVGPPMNPLQTTQVETKILQGMQIINSFIHQFLD